MNDVDFVVNCYERTYRDVLRPGFVSWLAESQIFRFSTVTVLVNNVDDPSDAEAMAKELLEADPGVDRVEFVADHLARGLTMTELRPRHLRHLPHFSDCCLVAVTMPGPPWVCYWDADARLRVPSDWITPVLEEMKADRQHLIGNPNNWHTGLAEREAVWRTGDLAIGYSVSDVAFLARREDLSRPIYRYVAPASWRFALSHIEPVWEQRVDAYMRRMHRTRVTYLPVTYDHVAEAGANYPRRLSVSQRARRRLHHHAVPLAGRISSHPALRNMPRSRASDPVDIP